jgi:hypothetical protein
MKRQQHRYRSLHEYLDDVFKNIQQPSDDQIKQAKKAYWKQWFTQYRRDQRSIKKEFVLRFDMDQLALIHSKRKELSVSQFLYASVHQALNTDNTLTHDSLLLKHIDHGLMQLINVLEELLDTEHSSLDESILERIEHLEQQFSMLYNTQS